MPSLTFMVDLTFGKILNIRERVTIGKLPDYLYSYSSRAKGFISANGKVSAL